MRARTGFRNIAEEIAKRLRMNYAFGHEFQELTQGRPDRTDIPRPGDPIQLADSKFQSHSF